MKIPTNLTEVAILLAWSKPSLEQTWKKFFFLIRRNRPPPLTSNTSLSGGDATLCIMEYISCKCVNYERDFSIFITKMNLTFFQRFGSSTKIWTKNSCIAHWCSLPSNIFVDDSTSYMYISYQLIFMLQIESITYVINKKKQQQQIKLLCKIC